MPLAPSTSNGRRGRAGRPEARVPSASLCRSRTRASSSRSTTPTARKTTKADADDAAGVVVCWARLSARQLLLESGATGDADGATGVGAGLRWVPFARDPLTERLARRTLGLGGHVGVDL